MNTSTTKDKKSETDLSTKYIIFLMKEISIIVYIFQKIIIVKNHILYILLYQDMKNYIFKVLV